MKKLLALLLCFALLASALFTLTACNIDLESFIEDYDDDDDYGDDDDDGENKGVLEISEDAAKQKMNALAAGDGYCFTFTADYYGTVSTCKVGRKGGTFWVLNGEDGNFTSGTAYQNVSGGVNAYSYDSSDGWSFSMGMTGDTADDLIDYLSSVYEMWLYFGNSKDEKLVKTGEGKIAGRSCVNYSYSEGSALTGTVSYNLSVDKELGITLSLHLDAKYGSESAALDYEISEFLTGSAVTVPALGSSSDPLTLSGLTEEDLKAGIGQSIGNVLQLATTATLNVNVASVDLATFSSWINALADKCRALANDHAVYADEDSEAALPSIPVDQDSMLNGVEFVYTTGICTIKVAAIADSESGSFFCALSVESKG